MLGFYLDINEQNCLKILSFINFTQFHYLIEIFFPANKLSQLFFDDFHETKSIK